MALFIHNGFGQQDQIHAEHDRLTPSTHQESEEQPESHISGITSQDIEAVGQALLDAHNQIPRDYHGIIATITRLRSKIYQHFAFETNSPVVLMSSKTHQLSLQVKEITTELAQKRYENYLMVQSEADYRRQYCSLRNIPKGQRAHGSRKLMHDLYFRGYIEPQRGPARQARTKRENRIQELEERRAQITRELIEENHNIQRRVSEKTWNEIVRLQEQQNPMHDPSILFANRAIHPPPAFFPPPFFYPEPAHHQPPFYPAPTFPGPLLDLPPFTTGPSTTSSLPLTPISEDPEDPIDPLTGLKTSVLLLFNADISARLAADKRRTLAARQRRHAAKVTARLIEAAVARGPRKTAGHKRAKSDGEVSAEEEHRRYIASREGEVRWAFEKLLV
ncbi:Hypothetical protein D9617_23g004960 [Elsinoe fawcettii]|nr:Hypothetical protein D9617_23g004960 [Elsinoe fawcettii]